MAERSIAKAREKDFERIQQFRCISPEAYDAFADP
jgi:hypothetical protein